MILQKKTINNVPTLVPLTADTGSGVPVGTIIGQYKKVNMSGYLYLDGSTFDQTLYPALYAYLGTNVLPDYREFVLVGAEQNTTSAIIHNHDVFIQGQEKDDQLQDHTHKLSGSGDTSVGNGSYQSMHQTLSVFDSLTGSNSGRSGTTTRTKEKAVFWYIKATTGIIESEATEMLNVFNNRMFPDYAHPITIPSGTTSWTATEDCYVDFTYVTGPDSVPNCRLTINGNVVSVYDLTTVGVTTFSGFVKKGQIVSTTIGTIDLSRSDILRFFPLTN